MLEAKTPIGRIQIPEFQERELIQLTDEELLQRAILENKKICVSPAVYAMIEKRGLERTLQQRINPNVGVRHDILRITNKW